MSVIEQITQPGLTMMAYRKNTAASVLESYNPLDIIGRGAFGVIRKVERDGKYYARKELDFCRMGAVEQAQIMGEINILSALNHPNIVQFEEKIIDEHNKVCYIVMEYCEGGDLGDLIRRHHRAKSYIPEETIWNYLVQLILALDACHYRPPTPGGKSVPAIIHRDLKPGNVFLDRNNNVKIGDFGLSKELAAQSLTSTYVGTPYYMSPELTRRATYDAKSDIWALGCIAFELCALMSPFETHDHNILEHKIKSGNIPDIPHDYSDALGNLVRWMLEYDPEKRPTTKDLLDDHYIHFLVAMMEYEERSKADREEMEERERALAAREEALAARERSNADSRGIEGRERALVAREEALIARERSLAERERQLIAREQLLQAPDVSMRDVTLDDKENQIYKIVSASDRQFGSELNTNSNNNNNTINDESLPSPFLRKVTRIEIKGQQLGPSNFLARAAAAGASREKLQMAINAATSTTKKKRAPSPSRIPIRSRSPSPVPFESANANTKTIKAAPRRRPLSPSMIPVRSRSPSPVLIAPAPALAPIPTPTLIPASDTVTVPAPAPVPVLLPVIKRRSSAVPASTTLKTISSARRKSCLPSTNLVVPIRRAV